MKMSTFTSLSAPMSLAPSSLSLTRPVASSAQFTALTGRKFPLGKGVIWTLKRHHRSRSPLKDGEYMKTLLCWSWIDQGHSTSLAKKTEDAEVALLAPDAVMGSRLIKLTWANRDSIPAEAESSGNVVLGASHGASTASVASYFTGDKGKENMPSATSNTSTVPGPENPVAATVPSRSVGGNGTKVTPPLQKKLESFELLKEELRMK